VIFSRYVVANSFVVSWWRPGTLSRRLLLLGASVGTGVAVAARIYFTITEFNLAFLQAGVMFLVFFEIPVGIAAGLAFAALAVLGTRLVPRQAPPIARATVTGIIAWGSSAVFVALYTNNLSMFWTSWTVGGIAGFFIGLGLSIVSYRHRPAWVGGY
jgi:hypothetical protein